MFNLRSGRISLFTETFNLDGNMAPSMDVVAHAQNFTFHDRPAGFLRSEIGARQKDLPHSDQFTFARFMTGTANLVIEKRHRDLHMYASAIPRFSVSINRASVPYGLKRGNSVFDHFTAGFSIYRDHKPHTTGGMFILFAVQAVLSHPSALCRFFRFPVFIKFCHFKLLSRCLVQPPFERKNYSPFRTGLLLISVSRS